MPPIVIDVQNTPDLRDVVHRAVQALVEGQLVVFPTETVYGVAASALNAEAVDRLMNLKSRQPGQPLALSLKSADDAWDYVPSTSGLGRRLARRCWPGPVTLVLDDNDHPDSLLRRLPESVQKAVCPSGTLGVRVPAHELVLDVLDMLAGPIALTSANRHGEPPATTAKVAIDALGDDVHMILDDGESRFGEASSVVQVTDDGLKILRAGVVNESTLNRLSTFLVVVVCTGNTCRSPMGEALMRNAIAKRIGCTDEELEDQGVLVISAGIAAMSGGRASVQSVDVMKERGLNIDDHASQPVTDRLVRHADLIFTMTNGHRAGLLAQWPEAAPRTHLLCPDGRDVSDPIGGPLELYARCAEQIDNAIIQRVEEMDLDGLRPRTASDDSETE
ncbi:MAG: L-threonylcarbamoyladenylate synthase [Planctomycetota bacterium]